MYWSRCVLGIRHGRRLHARSRAKGKRGNGVVENPHQTRRAGAKINGPTRRAEHSGMSAMREGIQDVRRITLSGLVDAEGGQTHRSIRQVRSYLFPVKSIQNSPESLPQNGGSLLLHFGVRKCCCLHDDGSAPPIDGDVSGTVFFEFSAQFTDAPPEYVPCIRALTRFHGWPIRLAM